MCEDGSKPIKVDLEDKYIIDYSFLHRGIQELNRNPNPYTGGVNFDDLNELLGQIGGVGRVETGCVGWYCSSNSIPTILLGREKTKLMCFVKTVEICPQAWLANTPHARPTRHQRNCMN